MNAEKQVNQIAKLFGDWSFREDAAKRIVQYWWHIQMIMADPVAPAPKQIPTNPDGSPLDVVNFVRIVNWTNSAMKTLEAWTGHKWQMTAIGATRQWGNVRDLIIAVDDNEMRIGREAHWGSPITRDSNTGAQVEQSSGTPSDTSHLPAGDHIGAVAIERNHGATWDYYDVHLWNGLGWVTISPGSFADEKTATTFANELTGRFDETSDGGICTMGHDFRCRRCGEHRPMTALAGERPDTVTKIMGGAFRVTKTPNDHWAVERYRWSSLLEDCGPEFWPWRTFESEDAAETTILRYGHRVNETVTLVRRDGAEIVSAAPGAPAFPRQVDDMPTPVEVTRTALTDIVEASTIAMPTPGTLCIRPDLVDPARKWIVYRWDMLTSQWIPAHDFQPCDTYWQAVTMIRDNTPLMVPSNHELDRWAQQGIQISPPSGATTPETIADTAHNILAANAQALAAQGMPVIMATTFGPAPAMIGPASAIEIGTCEIHNGDVPGDCFDVGVWTGHTWRLIAKGVSKRTAEGVVQARKNDTETEPVNPIKQTVIKRQRRLMAEVKRKIGEFHVDILGRQDRGDTVIGINELRDKLAMVLDYFND